MSRNLLKLRILYLSCGKLEGAKDIIQNIIDLQTSYIDDNTRKNLYDAIYHLDLATKNISEDIKVEFEK